MFHARMPWRSGSAVRPAPGPRRRWSIDQLQKRDRFHAGLARDDPNRPVAADSAFLQASLFTSVVAFGVAALVVGLGLIFILLGWALRKIGSALAYDTATTTTSSSAYPDPVPAGRPTAPPAPTTSTTPPPAPTGPKA